MKPGEIQGVLVRGQFTGQATPLLELFTAYSWRERSTAKKSEASAKANRDDPLLGEVRHETVPST